MTQGQDGSHERRAQHGLRRKEIEGRISKLRATARQGGWGLAVFILLSMLAIPDVNVIPPLPEKLRQALGAAPKAEFISLALVVYVFSALTLSLARLMQGAGKYRGWSHLFYITAFYIFYGFAHVMDDFFWAVFVSGLIILGLENYAIRTYCSEVIMEEEEKLEGLEKE